eukprot:2389326-Pyramimonas_sp.AAC.1
MLRFIRATIASGCQKVCSWPCSDKDSVRVQIAVWTLRLTSLSLAALTLAVALEGQLTYALCAPAVM